MKMNPKIFPESPKISGKLKKYFTNSPQIFPKSPPMKILKIDLFQNKKSKHFYIRKNPWKLGSVKTTPHLKNIIRILKKYTSLHILFV
jgi:hypothetical protein